MKRRRSWLVLMIVALTLLALLMQRVAAPVRSATSAAPAVQDVRVATLDDGTALRS